jgi:hypothetical protein
MAIQFLNGLNIDGNIDLNSNQIKEVRIDNESSAPTGSLGRIYYDTTTSKLRLYNGAWVDIDTGTDGDTTYDLSGVGSTNGTAGVRLAGSDGTNDDVIITGAGTVGVTRSGNTLTVTGTDSAAGTVTSVSGGTGISISGSSTVTPTVNIDTVGTDNAILVLTAADPVGTDYVWFSDSSDSNTLRKTLISAMPGFGKDGTVTSVGSGAGLTGGAITASGSLAVDYAGSDNVVLAAADGTGITVASGDRVLVSDATDSNAKYVNISQLTTAVGGGTVTSVNVSGGSTGLTTSGGPVTGSGTITLAGTLDANNGGTGQSSYTVGDILYASSTTALSKLGIGTAGQVLKVASGVPSWATDQNSGGTVTSITNAADTGTGTAITGSGTFTYTGGTNITTSVSGTTVTINTSATTNTGTVTSIATGNGISGGTITTSGTLTVSGGDGLNQTSTGLEVDSTVVRTSGTQTIAGVKTFSSQVTIPTTPASATDAASKSYVDSVSAGQLIFQGGYDATANPPTGASVLKGFTYVVTVAGSGTGGFWSVPLEIGDLVISNQDNPVDEDDWTEVNKNVSLATTTTVGVASFAAASFAVSGAGSVTVKAGGISDAQLASTFNKIIGTDSDINTSGVEVMDQINVTDGVIQSMSKRTLPTTSTTNLGVVQMATAGEAAAGGETNIAISPATLAAVLDKESYNATFPATTTNTTTIAAATHALGTGPFVVQVYKTDTGVQQFLDVTTNLSTGAVTLATTSNQTAGSLTVAIVKIR